MSHSGMRELGAKNAAVPRLDVLSLRLHRLWIVFHQLDGGERSAVCLLLHEAMEGAHAEGIDESLLRLDAEQKALEQQLLPWWIPLRDARNALRRAKNTIRNEKQSGLTILADILVR
jgi:hypothetical protein